MTTAATTITTPPVPTGTIDSGSCSGTDSVIRVLVVVAVMIIVLTTAPTSYGAFPLCPLSSCSGGGGRGTGGGGGLTLLLPTITNWTTLSMETIHTGNV